MERNTVQQLLSEHILNSATQWSLGTFGGIAEFSRDADEPVQLLTSKSRVAAATERGAVAIDISDDLRPFASESITRQGWSHRVALCLPEEACAMNRRDVLTELGPDANALREQDQSAILFDLGLDALQADLCIRINDPDAVGRLRSHTGRSVFETGNPAMGIILSINPHRVFISRIGRLEVYQPIPPATGKSPYGPHTHVLPKLLRSKRTHAATEPVPEGWVPCAHFYPAHAAKDAMGEARSFDRRHHDAFQSLIETLGSADAAGIKKRVTTVVLDGEPPFAPSTIHGHNERTAIRIALRQLRAMGLTSPTLPAWFEAFDRSDYDGGDEEDAEQQHGH
jgi:hypothetical protein